jgi:hypothetical protein
MNFSVGEVYSYLSSLRREEDRLQAWADAPPQPQQLFEGLGGLGQSLPNPFDPGPAPKFAPDEDKKRVSGLVDSIKKIADRHHFKFALHRIGMLRSKRILCFLSMNLLAKSEHSARR